MIIDEVMAVYDVRSRHTRRLPVPPERAMAAVAGLDLARDPLVRILFRLRGLPAGAGTWAGLEAVGFTVLGHRDDEVAVGITGRFWTPSGGLVRLDRPAFRHFDRPGYAQAVWNFTTRSEEQGGCVAATETRVACTDEAARRAFRRYWLVVGPFSALIRRRALGLVAAAV